MKEYNNFTEFYVALEQVGVMPDYNEHVSHFRNMVMGLGSGCGCTREKRISQVRSMYHQMCTKLTESEKQYIKDKLEVEKITLKEEDEIFCVF
jgi:hypothetical protein